MKQIVGLQDVEFYAFHGYYDEERKMGNHFIVNTHVEITANLFTSEDLTSTINYQDIYTICKNEMDNPQKLLETVASNILNKYKTNFQSMKTAYIKINKLQPQLGGKLHSSFVEFYI